MAGLIILFASDATNMLVLSRFTSENPNLKCF